ncbi:hypothetical protein CEP52_016257 [Fusarium oligoseptatum]|uniref:Uncharacterized protein n=1 Tax=Fusarium oligoseptatum TaxID=2604345 RepID=A0A428S5Q1_9HYPO|nr:hypothetical protein CEP52_016257 [Fusarium oligoseptatum]
MSESLGKHERGRLRLHSSLPWDGFNSNSHAALLTCPDLGNNRQPVLRNGTTSSLSGPNGCLVLDTRNRETYQPSKPAQPSGSDVGDKYLISRPTNEQEDDCDDMCPTNPPNYPTVHFLSIRSMRMHLHYEATISPELDLLEPWSLPYTGYAGKDGMPSVGTISVRYSLAFDAGCDSAGASDRVDVPEADSEQWC